MTATSTTPGEPGRKYVKYQGKANSQAASVQLADQPALPAGPVEEQQCIAFCEERKACNSVQFQKATTSGSQRCLLQAAAWKPAPDNQVAAPGTDLLYKYPPAPADVKHEAHLPAEVLVNGCQPGKTSVGISGTKFSSNFVISTPTRVTHADASTMTIPLSEDFFAYTPSSCGLIKRLAPNDPPATDNGFAIYGTDAPDKDLAGTTAGSNRVRLSGQNTDSPTITYDSG